MNAQSPIVQINPNTISVANDSWPQSLCLEVALVRIDVNLRETGHPFHHLTANGAIVDADPTTEYLLSRLSPSQQEAIRSLFHPSLTVLPTVPVNRRYYGIDPYGEGE